MYVMIRRGPGWALPHRLCRWIRLTKSLCPSSRWSGSFSPAGEGLCPRTRWWRRKVICPGLRVNEGAGPLGRREWRLQFLAAAGPPCCQEGARERPRAWGSQPLCEERRGLPQVSLAPLTMRPMTAGCPDRGHRHHCPPPPEAAGRGLLAAQSHPGARGFDQATQAHQWWPDSQRLGTEAPNQASDIQNMFS